MRKSLLGAALLAAIATGSAHASSLDISLGDESANIMLMMEGANLSLGGADVGAGVFFNENDDIVLHANWLGVNARAAQNQPYSIAAGAKLYMGELDAADESLGGIGVGGRVALVRPHPTMPMSFGVEAYYAPNITSFGDAENILELNVRFELDITPSTKVYAGYRLLEAEFEGTGDVELDDSVHFGVRIPLN